MLLRRAAAYKWSPTSADWRLVCIDYYDVLDLGVLNCIDRGTEVPRPPLGGDLDGSFNWLVTEDAPTHHMGKIEGPQTR